MLNIRVVVASAALFVALGAHAQTYPSKPITVIVPASPGSLTDYSARALSNKLAERLKQPVVVDNRPGANGQIAMERVIAQKPDGYTLTLAPSSTHAGNPNLFKTLRYDPLKDFTPIARVAQTALVVAVNNALPVQSLEELIAYAKERPGELSYAWANSGSLVSMETIRFLAGLNVVGVPYKASSQALTDLMAGHVDMYVIDFQTAAPMVKSGKVRALAVTTAETSPVFPDLPPVSDTFPGFEVVAWNALMGPAGMPKDIVDRLAREVDAILLEKDTQAGFFDNGLTVMPSNSPEDLGKYVSDQIVLWSRLVQQAGIQPQ